MHLQTYTTKPKFQVLPWTNQEVIIPEENQRLEFINIDSKATLFTSGNNFGLYDSTPKEDEQERLVSNIPLPEVRSMTSVDEGALTAVIQIWEGVVLSVDHDNALMVVKLIDRTGNVKEHSAEIDLQWVVDQDRDMLTQGAVFYWTLYKETKRGSIKNSQEIKFRRLPNWSKTNINLMHIEAESLAAKFSKASRLAD